MYVKWGRFTSEDIVSGSMLSPLTFNKYKYCMNSPLVYVDVDGRNECPLGWINDETPSAIVGFGGFVISTFSSLSDVLVQSLSNLEQLLKAFSGVGSHANAFKGFKSIKLLKGIAKISPFLDCFAIAYDVAVGTVVGVIVGVLSFVFLDCIKYGKDKKTGRKILKEGVYESAPTIGEAAALNASHFQLGETLIMGAR